MKKILPFLIVNVFLYLIFSYKYGTFDLIHISEIIRSLIASFTLGANISCLVICGYIWLKQDDLI